MRVHILDRGLCQECEAEVSWKRGDYEIAKHKQKKAMKRKQRKR